MYLLGKFEASWICVLSIVRIRLTTLASDIKISGCGPNSAGNWSGKGINELALHVIQSVKIFNDGNTCRNQLLNIGGGVSVLFIAERVFIWRSTTIAVCSVSRPNISRANWSEDSSYWERTTISTKTNHNSSAVIIDSKKQLTQRYHKWTKNGIS